MTLSPETNGGLPAVSRCQKCGEWFDDPWMSMYCPGCEDYIKMRREEEDEAPIKEITTHDN